MSIWKSFIDIITKKTDEELEMEIHPEEYKICPDCEGLGWIDMFVNCDSCNKTGYVRKVHIQKHID